MRSLSLRPFAFFGIGIGLASCAWSAQRTPEELFRAPVVYQLPGMDSVRVTRDLVYQKVDGVDSKADLYLPGEGARFPVVVFVHGGFPEGIDISGKDSGQYKSWGRLVAASGMAAVAFNHRLRMSQEGAVHLEEAASDLRAVIAWIRSRAADLNLDSQRLAVFAVSAGGPLLTVSLKEPGVRCLVDYYGFLDVHGLRWFMKAVPEERASTWSLTDALGHENAMPPLLIARAGHDQVPQMKDSIDRFVARALATDAPITLVNHATGQHAFDIQNDDARSREIIELTLRFLRSHLLG